MREEPNQRVTVRIDSPFWGYWQPDGSVALDVPLLIENRWVYPLTLTKLTGKVTFKSGAVPEELMPFLEESVLSPLQPHQVTRPYRLSPTAQHNAAPQPDPTRLSLLTPTFVFSLTFEGAYGHFVLRPNPLQGSMLLAPRQ